ncbi:MAG: tail fiber domain-containing protein [Phycisphaerales bacterium JB059]
MRARTWMALIGVLLSSNVNTQAHAMGVLAEPPAPTDSSPIVYRGRLAYLDLPVTTTADVRFRFFESRSGGEPIGEGIELEQVDLDDGWFDAVLDFGLGRTEGWLEVSVRSPAGVGEYVTLEPRQRVSGPALVDGTGASEVGRPGEAPTPDESPRGAGWTMSGSNIYFTGGNVGVGTAAPNAPLHVVGAGDRVMRVINTPSNGSGWGLFAEANGNASRAIFGRANRTVGQNYGVFGQSLSSRGTGVFGQANSTFGITYGVTGVSRAASGTGVRGLATNTAGSNVGVYGETKSTTGLAGQFVGGTGVTIDKGTTGSFDPALRIDGGQIYLFEESGGANFANIGYIDGGAGDQLVLTADGNINITPIGGGVGIGRRATANELEVEGTASKTSAGTWLSNSDARIKTNVQTLEDALDTLDRIRLVSFEYEERYLAGHPQIERRRYLNVIAQEFAEVFPEHVRGSGEYLPDGSEILQVDTYPLTIYSAAAIQELRGVVREQESRIKDLESRLLLLERLLLEE